MSPSTPAPAPVVDATEVAPIPVYRPYLGPEVQAAAAAAIEAGWLGMGRLSQQFEEEIDRFLGLEDRHAVATNSCTEALALAANLIGLGPGDEVIAPSFTYVAGHQALTRTGASIVFCDVEPDTLCIDPAKVEQLITPATKAILAVDYLGLPCKLDELMDIARRHGLRVIEDAAHAFGTRVGGRAIGSFGDITCFSFGPVKTITTLEGGAIITSDPADVQTLHELRMLGIDSDTDARYKNQRNWDFDVVRQGFRCHLGSVPAAIGLSQLSMIDEFIANRQQYCRRYDAGLSDVAELTLFDTDWVDVAPYIYVIRVTDPQQRAGLMTHLKQQGISTGIHFLGAHEFTFYKDSRRGDLSVTELATEQVVTLPLHSYMSGCGMYEGSGRVGAEQVVTLPLHSYMSEPDIDRVIAGVRSFFAEGAPAAPADAAEHIALPAQVAEAS